jgi:hypothetical protein
MYTRGEFNFGLPPVTSSGLSIAASNGRIKTTAGATATRRACRQRVLTQGCKKGISRIAVINSVAVATLATVAIKSAIATCAAITTGNSIAGNGRRHTGCEDDAVAGSAAAATTGTTVTTRTTETTVRTGAAPTEKTLNISDYT